MISRVCMTIHPKYAESLGNSAPCELAGDKFPNDFKGLDIWSRKYAESLGNFDLTLRAPACERAEFPNDFKGLDVWSRKYAESLSFSAGV